ncbi:MAG: hypothetical protein GWP19_02210, partial [Planctomycetia bacterium]|nr:hypothetical protein [Planctomycetia bacterium]
MNTPEQKTDILNQNPIFIAGAHKSGTSLLRSLLDGHSSIYAIPIETHYFQLVKFWVDNEYRKQFPKILSNEQLILRFINWIDKSNKSKDKLSDSITMNVFDLKKFKKIISKCEKDDSDKIRIQKYFAAIYYSQFSKQIPANIRIVEKSVENAEFAVDLAQYFPNAKFIHILRNPYSNFVSLRKYKSIKFGYPIMRRIIRTLYNNYYFLSHNKRRINNYYVLKYEDLVSDPRREIERLCNFLNLTFEEILLTPTSLGKLWAGNSTSGTQFWGIDTSTLNHWKSNISDFEVCYINKLFTHVFEEYDYPLIEYNKLKYWLPNSGEDLKR